jgi:archaellum component FlaC
MDYQVYDAFAQELQAHGYSMGGPLTAVGGIQEKLQEVSEKVEKLEKEVKRLRRKR